MSKVICLITDTCSRHCYHKEPHDLDSACGRKYFECERESTYVPLDEAPYEQKDSIWPFR